MTRKTISIFMIKDNKFQMAGNFLISFVRAMQSDPYKSPPLMFSRGV